LAQGPGHVPLRRGGRTAAVPSSMIFLGLVVVWLLILVPAVARHRQEVAKPSTAALSFAEHDLPVQTKTCR